MGNYLITPAIGYLIGSPEDVFWKMTESYMDTSQFKSFIEEKIEQLKALEKYLEYPSNFKLWVHTGALVVGLLIEKVTCAKRNFRIVRAAAYYMAAFAYFESVLMYHGIAELSIAVKKAVTMMREKADAL